ncbi:hypothetical protein RMCBS344292_17335 [Rhizopus microsporus]|nr:hypothetical protein RMCBS344292_15931 [Rhizopus microsporus]CEJ03349.1 hypothetical protein RMCBS344292_17335 [Rhizopus microsporus]
MSLYSFLSRAFVELVMEHITNINENVAQDQQTITLTNEQLELLLNEFASKIRTEEAERRRDDNNELPSSILSEMEETLSTDMHITIKRYARDIPFYDGGSWTRSEIINKSFVSYLKRYKVDAHSTISQKYKDVDRLRLAAREATEIFEDLQYIKNHEGNQAAIDQIMEKTRRLSIYIFASARHIDKEARELTTKLLNLPENVRYLEDDNEEDSRKQMAFSSEIVEKFNQARFEQHILRAAANRGHNYR